ncbi:MAG: helix-turn-helix transcriptional regulator [Oscillospiraceae bacterium]|nr:helix-turn-helix transcriptional regulator [Oscillospiraceae bacterium]
MSIAENIRVYLEENGIMQLPIARKSGMKPDAFSNAMKGKRKIAVDEYIRICAALNQPLERFVDGEEKGA